jgi:hypothetical protein
MARHNDTGKLGELLALQWAIDNDLSSESRIGGSENGKLI